MKKKVTLDKVAYEPHPVSLERKRELNAKGFRIVDVRFAPAGSHHSVEHEDDGRAPEADQRAWLIKELTERGIEFDESMSTVELRALSITPLEQSQPDNSLAPSVADGLDDLDATQLHALAKERGVSVHHKAGADKVRDALREAAKAE